VRLRYTLPALADLSAILYDIAAHSPQGARRVQARIQALTVLLLQNSSPLPLGQENIGSPRGAGGLGKKTSCKCHNRIVHSVTPALVSGTKLRLKELPMPDLDQ
jgi:hypothetical protein